MTQKILLTGASGGLGHRVLQKLREVDVFSICALVHRRPLKEGICKTIRADLLDPSSLLKAVEGCDTVLHMAALTHSNNEFEYFRVNFEGTENLITACQAKGVSRFIFVSSRSAQADGGAYAVSKLRAEEAVKASGLSWLILQPGECYGPGLNDPINRLAQSVQRWPFIPCISDENCKLSPIYVEDVVEAIVSAVKSDRVSQESLVLAGPESMTFEELVDSLCLHFKVNRRKIFLSLEILSVWASISSRFGIGTLVPDQIPRLLCKKPEYDPSTEEKIGFSPKNIEQGLKLLFP